MKLFIAMLGFLVATSVHGQTLEATSTWSSGPGSNGHTYALYSVTNGINWGNAAASAVTLGGTLATITSAEENLFVYSSLSIATNNNVWTTPANVNYGPWLGAFQPAGSPEPAGGYQWVTGEAFSYTSWSPESPNDQGGENVIHYFGLASRSSNWNDFQATSQQINGFVVESVPAPASLTVFAGLALLGRRRRIP